MSEVLTVPTAFGDISDLTEGLVDRVDGDQLILYGPTPYAEGAEIDFSVLLLDGTPALEGRGRVEASVDGGEDRDPSTRFDIILGSLELGGVAEAVYERMLMARSSMLASQGDVPADADVDFGDEAPAEEAAYAEEAPVEEAPVEEAAAEEPAIEEPAVEEPAAEAQEAAPAEASEDWGTDVGGFDDEATVVDDAGTYDAPAAEAESYDAGEPSVDEGEPEAEEPAAAVSPAIAIPTELPPPDDAFRGAAPPEAPGDPGGFGVSNDLAEGLVRPVQQATWTPVAPPRPEPRPSSGLFQYGATIPLPDAPPRPDLDPSLVVTRAPHPSMLEAAEAPAPAYEPEPEASYEAEVADEAEVVEAPVDEEAPAEGSGEYETVSPEGEAASPDATMEFELEAEGRD